MVNNQDCCLDNILEKSKHGVCKLSSKFYLRYRQPYVFLLLKGGSKILGNIIPVTFLAINRFINRTTNQIALFFHVNVNFAVLSGIWFPIFFPGM